MRGLAVDQSDRPWPGHKTKPTDSSSQIQLDQSDLAQPDSMQDQYESGDNDNEEKPLLGMRVLSIWKTAWVKGPYKNNLIQNYSLKVTASDCIKLLYKKYPWLTV